MCFSTIRQKQTIITSDPSKEQVDGVDENELSDPIDPPKPGTGTSTGNMQGVIPAGQPNAGAPDGVDVAAEVLDEVAIVGTPKAKTTSDYYGSLEFNYNGLNDVLLGVGVNGFKNSYNSNYEKFNSAYYNFYKAMGKSSKLPKPGAQRQMLKKLLSNSKFSASSKLLRRAGIAGAVLTVGNIGLDVAEDGAIKASSLIDGGSLAALGVATVFCPPCAVAIGAGLLVYGVLDYTFEINNAIDANTEQIQIFDK